MNKEKQRILFITYFAANEPLLDSRTTPVLRELTKSGIEYHLITFEKKGGPNNDILFYDADYLRDKFNRSGIKWHPLNYHKRPLTISTLYDILVGIFHSIFILIAKNIDFIHAQTAVGGAIAVCVAKAFKKKFIYDINGLLAEEYADAGIWNRKSIVFKMVRGFEKYIIFNADGIIPLSKRFAETIREGKYIPYKKMNWNLQVIPSHVDTNRFKCEISRDIELQERYNLKGKFVIIYVGSVGTWYMFSEMLDFFNVAKKLIPEAIFLILTHTHKDIVRYHAYTKGIRERNIIITEVLPHEVPRYLSVADSGIFFIKSTFSKQACSPIKLGEYLASGLPVVINSNVGDTDILVKSTNTGVVIDRFEENAYKDAALNLKHLIDTDKGLKKRCYKTAQEHLSLDTAIEKYKRLYKDTFKIP